MRKNISIDDTLSTKVDEYCRENNYGFSELIAELLRHRIMGVDIIKKEEITKRIIENIAIKSGTMPPKIETGTTPKKYIPIEDELWEDSNWVPVKKIRIPNSFCSTWHEKGLKQDVYFIKRFDGYDKLLWSKNLCKECVMSELENCKTHGGHLE